MKTQKYYINYEKGTGKILGFAKLETGANIEVTNAQYVKAMEYEKYNTIVIDEDNISFSMVEYRKDSEILETAKVSKINKINKSCTLEITSGFMSNAVDNEVFLKYESEQIDQLNLIGLASSNKDALLKSGLLQPKENENDEDVYNWEFRPHTALQLKKVFDDGVSYKEALLLKAYKLKAQVSEATTIEAVNAIVW